MLTDGGSARWRQWTWPPVRFASMLGPWKRNFTAGARYSPDGRQAVFEKVHKAGRGPDADIGAVTLVVVRLDRPGRPVRALTDARLYGATADWSPDGEAHRLHSLRRAGRRSAGPVLDPARRRRRRRRSRTWPTTAATPSNPPGYRTGAGCCSAAGCKVPGRPQLLSVRLDGSGMGSAFGDDDRLRVASTGAAGTVSLTTSRGLHVPDVKAAVSYSSRCQASPGTPSCSASVVETNAIRSVPQRGPRCARSRLRRTSGCITTRVLGDRRSFSSSACLLGPALHAERGAAASCGRR